MAAAEARPSQWRQAGIRSRIPDPPPDLAIPRRRSTVRPTWRAVESAHHGHRLRVSLRRRIPIRPRLVPGTRRRHPSRKGGGRARRGTSTWYPRSSRRKAYGMTLRNSKGLPSDALCHHHRRRSQLPATPYCRLHTNPLQISKKDWNNCAGVSSFSLARKE